MDHNLVIRWFNYIGYSAEQLVKSPLTLQRRDKVGLWHPAQLLSASNRITAQAVRENAC
jgi:hypothetical protein